MTESSVSLKSVWHRYGPKDSQWTLEGIDLDIAHGELLGLLGPSGCGKTTLLRLIAGFERPNQGTVQLQGRQVAGDSQWIPPERRGVGMVFQDYALFPHLTAWQNACFGLHRGAKPNKVTWLFNLLGLEGLEQRFPHQLSGGQRQRLALARALAPSPKLVLLDEPFSSLDVEVRLRLRAELAGVLKACDASGVIVTHDPGEALAVCDRVAVMRDGVLHQCATPQEIVRNPATPFVGSFVLQKQCDSGMDVQRRGNCHALWEVSKIGLVPVHISRIGPVKHVSWLSPRPLELCQTLKQKPACSVENF